MSNPIKVKFFGVDSWDRIVFRAIDKELYFGTLDILANQERLATLKLWIKSEHLYYFGREFDCEPNGGQVLLDIIWDQPVT